MSVRGVTRPRFISCLLTLASVAIVGCQSNVRGLNRAAKTGTVQDLESALAKGANVNEQGESNNRPLREAALYNNAVAAQWLIEHGASINAGDEDQDTPLHMAAQRG